MSKYDALWHWIKDNQNSNFKLTYSEIWFQGWEDIDERANR